MLGSDNILETIKAAALEELPKDGVWAVLTTDRADETRLRELCSSMGDRLVVQEVWKELLPQSPVLISSAICGGDLQARFEEATKERSCVLLLEPIRTRFPLPCLNGQGEDLTALPSGRHFYSDALCCYYAHTPEAAVLWDTDETLERKIKLAKDAGFKGIVK